MNKCCNNIFIYIYIYCGIITIYNDTWDSAKPIKQNID